jgi:hypothetical protein
MAWKKVLRMFVFLFLQDLEKYAEHLKNNHKHEMGIERARLKEKQRELTTIVEKHDRVQEQLKVRS